MNAQENLNAAIFGSTGFIGSHCLEQLLEAGLNVKAFNRSNPNAFQDALQKKHRTLSTTITNFQADTLEQDLQGIDVAYLCLASRNMHESYAALKAIEVTLNETIVAAAAKAEVKHIVLLSTVMVYGFTRPPTAIDETYSPEPIYQFNQVALERETALQALCKTLDINLTIIRPSNTIGKRDSQMFRLIDSVKQGFFPLFQARRDAFVQASVVDTRDIGRAMAFVAGNSQAHKQTFLVTGFDTSWKAIGDEIAQQLSKKPLFL